MVKWAIELVSKSESTGPTEKQKGKTRAVTTTSTVSASTSDQDKFDDPLQYLMSDSDDSDVLQVRLNDKGSECQKVLVSVQGVPVEGLVDTGADITIVGKEAFKRIAAAAKLRKKDFKPSDRTPRGYDQKPFHVDGRVDLDIAFRDQTMKTPVYVKMDASEQLLLSEGVCRQLGIVTYHPDVRSKGPAKKGKVPTVRVKLVQAVRLLPNQSILADTQVDLDGLGGCADSYLFEPDPLFQERQSVQMADGLVHCPPDGQVKVLLTNHLGMSQVVDAGQDVGSVLRVDTIKPEACTLSNVQSTTGSMPQSTSQQTNTRASVQTQRVVDTVEIQHQLFSNVTVVSSCRSEDTQTVVQRKQKLREVLGPELKSSNLSEAERNQLCSLLEDYHDVFCLDDDDRGETDLVELRIDTGEAQPKRQPPHRVPFAVRKQLASQIEDLQKKGIIQPSVSEWASPIVLVEKKDGTLRLCIDYRGLNAVTRSESFPIPRIDDLLDQLGKSHYFSTLDLASGFWQIKVHEQSRDKTAFVTHQGLFEFRVMPFGLTNAPFVFQKLMQRVLSGLNPPEGPEFVEVYIDDTQVFSRTMEDHLTHLKKVLLRFREANLKLKPSKCHFIRQSVEYLGYIITPEGLKPNPRLTMAVSKFPIPESVSQVRQFLGLTSYYRRFIKQFASIATPLHALTRKDVQFRWSQECQYAFDCLKDKLTCAPVLSYPDFDQPFVLETDASGRGLGAVLSQRSGDGQLRPVAFASRALSSPEKNYCISELETLAVVWAIQHFHAYLYGHNVTVLTDHVTVKAILETPTLSGKHARWWLKVFASGVGRVHIMYRPGSQNAKADVLSRNPTLLASNVAQVSSLEDCDISHLLSMTPAEQSDDKFGEEQKKDQKLRQIFNYLEAELLPENADEAKNVVKQAPNFVIVDSILYFSDPKHQNRHRVAVPSHLQRQILSEYHGGVMAGHFSGSRLYNTLCRRWWWKSMYQDAVDFCKNCAQCAVVSGTGRSIRPPLHPIPVSRPFQILGVDIMELPTTDKGNRYIIVFQDFLTKWPFVFPAPDQKAIRIVRLLTEEIVPVIGVPEALLSDHGTNLLAHVMLQTCQTLGIVKLNTTAYHPQCDGMVERLNRTLKAMLRKHAARFGKQWDQFLPGVLWAYRNTPHEATKEKPSFLLFGVDVRSPTEAAFMSPQSLRPADIEDYREELILSLSSARQLALAKVQEAQKHYKQQYDKKIRTIDVKIGDWVMVRFPQEESGRLRKLSQPWHGPYRVIRKNDPDLCVSEVYFPDRSTIQVHQSRVCKCPLLLPPGFYWYGGRRKNIEKIPQWLQQLDTTDDIAMATAEAQGDNTAAPTGELQDDDSTMARLEDMSDDNAQEDGTEEEEDTQDDTDETVNKRYSLRNRDSIRLPRRYVNRVRDELTPGGE